MRSTRGKIEWRRCPDCRGYWPFPSAAVGGTCPACQILIERNACARICREQAAQHAIQGSSVNMAIATVADHCSEQILARSNVSVAPVMAQPVMTGNKDVPERPGKPLPPLKVELLVDLSHCRDGLVAGTCGTMISTSYDCAKLSFAQGTLDVMHVSYKVVDERYAVWLSRCEARMKKIVSIATKFVRHIGPLGGWRHLDIVYPGGVEVVHARADAEPAITALLARRVPEHTQMTRT